MDDFTEDFMSSAETELETNLEDSHDAAEETTAPEEAPPAPEPLPETSPPAPAGPLPVEPEPLPVPPAEPVPEAPEPDVEDGDISEPLDLGDALGSLAAYFDTRSQLEEAPEEALELVGIETYALSPITGSSGLKGILLDVLGPYDNVVTQFKYQQANNSYYTYVNEITPDYPWIASAVLFIALVLSLFGLLKRSMTWLR